MSALLRSLFGVELLDPAWLWLLCLIPAVLLVRRFRGGATVVFAPGRFLTGPALPRTLRGRLSGLPVLLTALALAAMVLALARPVRRQEIPRRARGIDIVLILDVSSSMAAKDLDPEKSGLDLVRAAARRFLAGRPEDRFALITFARYPDLVCPLTRDHRALDRMIAAVQALPPESPEDATGIGTAVARAVQVVDRSPSPVKVAVLFTDGEENVATAESPNEIAPLHAAQLAEDRGLRVHAIVARGPSGAGGRGGAASAAPIRQLAKRTGGEYFEVAEGAGIQRVYDRIDALEKLEIDEPRFRLEERFLPFLLAGLALYALGRLLPLRRLEPLP